MSKTYNVGGMTCGGCAKSVAAAIAKAAPQAAVSVDHSAGKVTVDDAVAADTVKTAVEAAGFDYLGQAA
jgi:copper chaperone